MTERERGYLFSIRKDGSESLPPYVLKKDKMLFGRADVCDIRIYVDGVDMEHCALTVNSDGQAFIQPISKSGHTVVNGLLVENKVGLKHNDVITIVKRSFRFAYSHLAKYYWNIEKECMDKTLPSKARLRFFSVRKSLPTSGIIFNPGEPGPYILRSKRKSFDVNLNCPLESVKRKEANGKRVTFGPMLSPEEFDKNLPPSTPVRRGSLPGEKIKLCFVRNSETPLSALNGGLPMNNFQASITSEQEITSNDAKVLFERDKCSQLSKEAPVPQLVNPLNALTVDKEYSMTKAKHITKSKPLFSDVLKKPVSVFSHVLSPQKRHRLYTKRKFNKTVNIFPYFFMHISK